MANSIPIVLTPLPVPVGVQAIDLDQLITLICQFVQGSISTSVSFFQQGAVAPISNQGIFFNTTDNRFENWSAALGAYVPISESNVGDIKTTFVGGDNLPNGLVVLDGRAINSIVGLTQQQKTNLETLFGANANLPLFNFVSSISNVPAIGSFANISNPVVQPPVGVFSNLPVGSPPSQSDVIGLRTNCELLDESAGNTQGALAQSLGFCEAIIKSLNNAGGVTVYSKVFVGYPS